MLVDKSFIITDGEYYIYKNAVGKYIKTTNASDADRFTCKIAKNILTNSLPKDMRVKFRVEPADKAVTNSKEITESVDDSSITDRNMIEKWQSKFAEAGSLAKSIANRVEELRKKLSQVDQELSDLDHFTEFTKLNAAMGWRANNMRKQRLILRREIKDELAILQMAELKIPESNFKELEKAIARLNHRKYTPRVLVELFEEAV